MKILLIGEHEELKVKEELGIQYFDQMIEIYKELPNINNISVSNNELLKLIDFLIEKIGLKQKNSIYYFGKNPRIWLYVHLFATLGEDITLYHKNSMIENICFLKLNLKNIGVTPIDLKKELSLDSYNKLPKNLKSLYYHIDDKRILSKLGDVYVKNIKD